MYSLAWPCRFELLGFTEQLRFNEATNHFGVCLHQEQACCPWVTNDEGNCVEKMVLDKDIIVHHIITEHGIKVEELKGIGTEAGYFHAFPVYYHKLNERDVEVEDTSDMILFKHLNTHFILTFGFIAETYYLLVTAIGKKANANGLKYNIWCNGKNGRKFQYSGQVVSHENLPTRNRSTSEISSTTVTKTTAFTSSNLLRGIGLLGWRTHTGFKCNVSITRS